MLISTCLKLFFIVNMTLLDFLKKNFLMLGFSQGVMGLHLYFSLYFSKVKSFSRALQTNSIFHCFPSIAIGVKSWVWRFCLM